jgi:hypothetical protein
MVFHQLQGSIAAHLRIIGVPHHIINPFSELVVKWTSCSGKEWTVSRLKGLKTDLIRRRAGLSTQTPWIAKSRGGEFKGAIGSLFRWAMQSQTTFNKAVQAFMVYSIFTHTRVSKSQIEKFVDAVTSVETDMPDSFYKQFGACIRKNFPLCQIDRSDDNSLLLFRGSGKKRKPGFSWEPSSPQDHGVVAQANYFYIQEHKALGRAYAGLYNPVLAGLDVHREMIFDHPTDVVIPERVYGGNIAFIQEPGLKLRSVASPYLVHQLALRPLGGALYRLLKSLPWDCTFDQSKPFDVIKVHLSQGKPAFSFDLSNATDYFPLSIQLCALRSLMGKQPDIDLFEVLSRSTWRSPLGNIRWSKGQPLGLYPSFATFGLTHGLLLYYLNGSTFNEDFFVVGDDVVILSPLLAERYQRMLEQMGCPWSSHKSISSSNLAEFAGKLILPSGVVPQMKWRELSDDNFLDICRLLGPKSRSLLTPRQRKVFDLVKNLLAPLGLNFSSPGSNFQLMLERTMETFPEKDHVISSLMGLTSVVNRNVYTSEFKNPAQLVNWQVVLGKLEAFDEKVKLVLSKILGWDANPIGGFSGVPSAVGVSQLPTASAPISRVSSLERYEALLHIS